MPTLERAWRAALYATPGAGFYAREWPAAHFVTAPQLGPEVAAAVVAMAREAGLDTVVDVGAGRGELLAAAHLLDPGLRLLAVELRTRPPELPAAIGWRSALPDSVQGLLVAHELLDTVPCPVVEVDGSGRVRELHVDPRTGVEHAGAPVAGADLAWLRRWWPVTAPGDRAEVGRSRDDVWADLVGRVSRGLAVAVDYGHVRSGRPVGGSLRAYAAGRRVRPRYDGSVDVTADVALDAVADRGGGTLHRQRDLLAGGGEPTGPDGSLEPAGPASPAGRLAALSRAGREAQARAAGGLGELGWVITDRR